MHVAMIEKGKQDAYGTDDYVHKYPWTCIGIAAGVGILVGLVINRTQG